MPMFARIIRRHSSFLVSWVRKFKFPLALALALRVATSVWLAAVWLFIDPFFPITQTSIAETYNHLSMHTSLWGRALLDVWLRWDAVHYMNLAWGGYQNAGSGDMNFWPLYPYLVRLLSVLPPKEIILAGLMVSTISMAIATVYLWKLVGFLFPGQNLQNPTILLWIIYPTSFFLVAPFTDALFACLSVIALWSIYQRQWITAGFFCGLAGLTRSQGLLLIFPFVIALYQDWVASRRLITPRSVLGLAIAPMGTFAFLFWRWDTGLPDIFSSYSIYSSARIVDPLSGIYLALEQFMKAPNLLMLTELTSVMVFLSVQIWMITKAGFRRHAPLMAYGIVTILFILIKHNINATPLQSSNRYVLNAFPAFIGFASIYSSIPQKLQRIVIILSIAMAIISTTLYAMWIFIG